MKQMSPDVGSQAIQILLCLHALFQHSLTAGAPIDCECFTDHPYFKLCSAAK
jgi:hypothetical protein